MSPSFIKKLSPRHFIAAMAAITISAPTAVLAEEIWLTMDYVHPIKLDREAAKIIVGNPGIADVTVENATNLLLFGKAPGVTNMFIFDDDGEKIDNMIVRVRALGDNMMTYQRGSQRTTYNCLTLCEATVTVGDGESFAEVAQQTAQKYQQASSGN